MSDSLPYGLHLIEDDDVAAVTAALTSGLLAQGPRVQAFETALAGRLGATHARATSSGTSALHLALLALDVGPGDLVVVPAITFLSTATAARMCGAEVVFADVDPATGLMTPETFLEALAGATGPVKVALPVAWADAWRTCAGPAPPSPWRRGVRRAGRGLRPRHRLAPGRRAGRQLHPLGGGVLLVPPGQDHRRRRGRGRDHQRRVAGRTHRPPAQPRRDPRSGADDRSGAVAGRRRRAPPVELRAAGAGLQLPHDRHRGGARPVSAEQARPLHRPAGGPGRRLRPAACAPGALGQAGEGGGGRGAVAAPLPGADRLSGDRQEPRPGGARTDRPGDRLPGPLHPGLSPAILHGALRPRCGPSARAEAFYAQVLALPLFPAMADEDVDRVLTALAAVLTAD